MKKVFIIIKREYLTRVRTRAFLIGTIISPVLMLALILLPGLLAARGGGSRQVIVLDQSGDPALFDAIKRRTTSRAANETEAGNSDRQPGLARFDLTQVVVPPNQDIDEVRREYNAVVEKDYDKAYLALRPDALEGADPQYYARSVSDFSLNNLERAISAAITERRLVRAGFDQSKVSSYMKPIDLKTIKVGPEGESEESGMAGFIVSFIMLFFIYMTILIYGISVMRGVIEEKQSRIVEVVISSIKPTQMMLGKLIGIGLVGLTQYVIWVASAVLIAALGSVLVAPNSVAIPNVPISLLIYFIVYFVLGYFLFATLYAMVGAMVSSEEEAQQIQMPVTMIIIIPMLLFTMVMGNPNSLTSVALSLIPFFSPTLMILRIAIAPPPLWQILLSFVLMIATTLGAVWVAARIYRVGILMYGKRPSLAELGRWLRYT